MLFAGARPEDAQLADPGADRLRLVALDWDQAWADSGVTGKAGPAAGTGGHRAAAPEPGRPGAGLPVAARGGPARVRRSLAKLRTATGNDFLQIRPGAGADTLRLLVARDNPLPELAPFDFTGTRRPRPGHPVRGRRRRRAHRATTRHWTRTCCWPGSPAPGSPAWRRVWCTAPGPRLAGVRHRPGEGRRRLPFARDRCHGVRVHRGRGHRGAPRRLRRGDPAQAAQRRPRGRAPTGNCRTRRRTCWC